MATKPQVILFDEPTSALDPALVGEVLVAMQALAADHVTTVIVTHELAFERALSQEVVLIDKGMIVEKAPQKFFTNPESERAKQFSARYA